MIPLAIIVGGCALLWWLKRRPSRTLTYRCHCGRTFTTLAERSRHRGLAHPR